MIRFFFVLFAVCLLAIVLINLANHQSYPIEAPSFFYETMIFLSISTAIIYRYLYKIQKPDFFVQLYLLTMVVKFLGYGGYTYFMITTDKPGATLNVTFFMIIYFIFTGLEIAFLYHKVASKRNH